MKPYKRFLVLMLTLVLILSQFQLIPSVHGAESIREYDEANPIPESEILNVSSKYSGRVDTISIPYGVGSYTGYVYLPYNYDTNASTVYNVFVFIGGAGSGSFTVASSQQGKKTLDYLFANNLVEPFIFVSLPYSSTLHNYKNSILPALISLVQNKYRVYGVNHVPSDSVSAHYAIGGISSGASLTRDVMVNTTLLQCFDYYASVSYLGSFGNGASTVNSIWKNSGRKMRVFFTSAGESNASDPNNESNAYYGSINDVKALADIAEYRERWHFNNSKYSHGSWQNVCSGIYRFSQIIFKDVSSISTAPTSGSGGGGDGVQVGDYQYTPPNDKSGILAYNKNVDVTIQSFSDAYRWNSNSLKAETWTGIDGSSQYARTGGHQAEYYQDLIASVIDQLNDLGITSIQTGGAGGGTIAAIAKAEASATDSAENPMGSNRVKYNDWYYGHPVSGKDYPWCCAFVTWCANQCGYLGKGEIYESGNAASAAAQGETPLFNVCAYCDGTYNYLTGTQGFDSYPAAGIQQLGGSYPAVPGDIFFFRNTVDSVGRYGHIGIVTAVTENSIEVTQGNTGDKVMSITYTSGSLHDNGFFGMGSIVHVLYPGASPLTGGTEIQIPAGLGSYFTYMGWQNITDPSSNQYKLREEVGMPFDAEGFGKINGRYVIACAQTYGNVGDCVDFYQSDGTVICCVIGDIKCPSDAGYSIWGHNNGNNIVEFIVNNSLSQGNTEKDSNGIPNWYYGHRDSGGHWVCHHPNAGTPSCHPEWGGKTIVKCVNGGNYKNLATGTIGGTGGGYTQFTLGAGLNDSQQKMVSGGLAILQNNQLINSGYYIGCAGFIQGVYRYSGFDPGLGDAYDYWRNYSRSGSSDLSAIPVGAVVVGSNPNPWGHIGIYMGHSMVLHYTSGKVCLWPLFRLDSYSSEMVSYIRQNAVNWDGTQCFNNWSAAWDGGWCWPKNNVLSTTLDPTR